MDMNEAMHLHPDQTAGYLDTLFKFACPLGQLSDAVGGG